MSESPSSTRPTRSTKKCKVSTSDQFDEIFEVRVGNNGDARSWTLHKAIVCAASKYFKAALKVGTFKEGKNNFIELRDQGPKVFKEFIAWAYTKTFDGNSDVEVEKGESEECSLEFLVHLWAFADRFMVHGLGNKIMERMYDLVRHTYVYDWKDAIAMAFSKTPVSSLFRPFIIQLYVLEQGMDLTHGRFMEWTPEILWEVIWYFSLHRDIIALEPYHAFARLERLDHSDYHDDE